MKRTLGGIAARLALGATAALPALPASAGVLDDHPAVRRAIEQLLLSGSGSVPVALPDLFFGADVIGDADGSSNVRLTRTHQGLPVIGGDAVVQLDGRGNLKRLLRTLGDRIDIPTEPQVARAAAERHAISHVQADLSSASAESMLVIYARGGLPRLAWRVALTGDDRAGRPLEKVVFVDARRLGVLDAWDDLQPIVAAAPAGVVGQGQGLHSGTVPLVTRQAADGRYELVDPRRGGNKVTDMRGRPFSGGRTVADADNVWGNGKAVDPQSAAVDAAYGLAATWDYFLDVFGRHGIGDDGQGVVARVHWWRHFNNAGWSSSCNCVKFGDGDGRERRAFTTLDVTGHEVTHGLIARTAGLLFSGESGALNEATADIFGTMVEFHANNPADPPDYRVGEKTYADASGQSALRYMHRPSIDLGAGDGALDERDPLRRQSADCWYRGIDRLDVHYASGVANHFFYLLAEGSHPANGLPASPTCRPDDVRVATGRDLLAGIGRDAAAKIWYRALTVHMTSDIDHAGARDATLRAAADVYGEGSRQQRAVADAWAAVNVR